MNYSFIFRHLAAVCWMLGGFMSFSIPWALPVLGGNERYEKDGVLGLLASIALCVVCALTFRYWARCFRSQHNDSQELFSKRDATAIVGLSWLLAAVLGALPYWFSGTQRVEGIPMSLCDAFFESQSGFSTTGATVFAELERPDLLPRCILFWRCSTHFLGGLGIMVLFIVLLGLSTGSKTLFLSEATSLKSSSKEQIRQLAHIIFRIYIALNIFQTVLLILQGLTLYDALCHSFSTVSTGGFSTFNASAGHFAAHGYPYAVSIELTLVFFMLLGGTNFILLYYFFRRQPSKLFQDIEWRTYIGLIAVSFLIILFSGRFHGDFDNYGTADAPIHRTENEEVHQLPLQHTARMALFQTVSVITTTGLCTDEFEKWSAISCCILMFLTFIGACSGSTSGGFKVSRMIYLLRVIPQEIELSYRPNVVRPLFIGGVSADKETLYHIIVHFAALILVFFCGTFLILCFESYAALRGRHTAGDHIVIDAATAVVACLSNTGVGFGSVGARQNYGIFSEGAKLVFASLMMLGRLELFTVLALCLPRFWKSE